jgi:hypothetical protein
MLQFARKHTGTDEGRPRAWKSQRQGPSPVCPELEERKMQAIRQKSRPVVISLIILTAGGSLYATTWARTSKVDPISGESVTVHEYASYGNYIYDWPSKYDLVFWPLTDENWIWLNPKNGYAAFGGDFESLSEENTERLRAWLSENYTDQRAPESHEDKLLWLEKVYAQRNMDDDFWCRFYRLMAYTFREDEATSTAYVRKAMPLLKKKLQTNPEGFDKIQLLYLLGEYHRRLGDRKDARRYFAQAKTTEFMDEDGTMKKRHPYIVGLINDREVGKAKTHTLLGVTGLLVLVAVLVVASRRVRKRNAPNMEAYCGN